MRNDILLGYIVADDFSRLNMRVFSDCDVLAVIEKNGGVFNVKEELKGGACLRRWAALSTFSRFTFFLTDTEDFGVKRRSVVAFGGRKLLFIADQNRIFDKEFSPGYGYKSVTVDGDLRVGLCVEKDVADPDCLSVLSKQNDVIIDLSADFSEFNASTFVSAAAYIYRAGVAVLTKKGLYAAKSGGEIIASGKDVFGKIKIPVTKNFALSYTKIKR